MVCVTTVLTLQRARACVCLFFYTTAQVVYLHTVKGVQTRVQTSAGNKGCRCGWLPPPPPRLSLRGRAGGDGEAEPGCLVGCDGAPLSLFTHLFSSELTIKHSAFSPALLARSNTHSLRTRKYKSGSVMEFRSPSCRFIQNSTYVGVLPPPKKNI